MSLVYRFFSFLFLRKGALFFCCFTILFQNLQSQIHPPKREFRGVWIASVKNIDWPSRAGLSTEKQQAELLEMLDRCKETGLNAVIFQIRPAGEVFYESRFEPWSSYLNGEMGKAPTPYYDPLEFAINACHERGLEMHAWINPFRLNLDWFEGKELPQGHIGNRFPDWTFAYGKNLYVDPGNPYARRYILEIVSDVVKRYDIDAIHFDDYFYPYKIQGEILNDSLSFQRFNIDNLNLEDWRRQNINSFIRDVSDSIYAVKPFVELGISPFGVWRNISQDPKGSNTRSGQSSYDDLYADILKWMEEGWIDYVAPQIYWSRGFGPADFEVLLDWWERNRKRTKLYIGQALYKIDNNSDTNWSNPEEIPQQIRQIRNLRSVSGSIFFSAKWLKTNPLGIMDSLSQNHYYFPSLTPYANRFQVEAPLAPYGLETDSDPKGVAMIWSSEASNKEVKYYVVYRNKGRKIPLPLPEYQQTIVRSNDLYFLDKNTRWLRKYTYAITAVDWLGNESEISNFRSQRRWSRIPKKPKKEKATLGGR
ncbi:MAG: family 10 glycosylhydrolase [Bacteroidota bacterium]